MVEHEIGVGQLVDQSLRGDADQVGAAGIRTAQVSARADFEVGGDGGQHYFSMGFVDGPSLADRLARLRQGRNDEAETIFENLSGRFSVEQLAALTPTDVREEILRSYSSEFNSLGAVLKFTPQRVAHVERALAIDRFLYPDGGGDLWLPWYLMRAYQARGDLARALEIAAPLAAKNPTYADVQRQYIRLLCLQGKPREALEIVNRALDQAPATLVGFRLAHGRTERRRRGAIRGTCFCRCRRVARGAVAQQLVARKTYSALFRQMWRSPRGRALADDFAFDRLTGSQRYQLPIELGAAELVRMEALGRDLTAEQVDLVARTARDFYLAIIERGTLGKAQLAQLALAWKGVGGGLGWAGAAPALEADLRGRAAYFLAHRYLKLGRRADAEKLFREAMVAAPDSPAAKLAQADRLLAIGLGEQQKQVRLWRLQPSRPGPALVGHGSGIPSIAWRKDGRQLATAGHDNTVRIWEVDGRPGPVLGNQRAWVESVAWSPDGQWLASFGYDSRCRLWRADGNPGAVLERSLAPNCSVAFNAETGNLLVLGKDSTIKTYRPADGEWLTTTLLLSSGGSVVIGAGGEIQSASPQAEDDLLYIVETTNRECRLLSPSEFRHESAKPSE